MSKGQQAKGNEQKAMSKRQQAMSNGAAFGLLFCWLPWLPCKLSRQTCRKFRTFDKLVQ